MKLPFTYEEFLSVFKNYNEAVFPMQVILYLLAAFTIYLSVRKEVWTDKVISGILSFFWLWMGIAYHIAFFTTINIAAYFFGALFILQGGFFLWRGVFQNKLIFQLKKDIFGFVGILLIVFALIIYPTVSFFVGHVYPTNPTFGLPCPTTIFTFGLFLVLDEKYPKSVLIIPLAWAMIGFSASFLIEIKEDISLLVTALLSMGFLIIKHKISHRTLKT